MSVATRYHQSLNKNGWAPDSAQLEAVSYLDALLTSINTQRLPIWRRWFDHKPDAIRGLYLWGGVGRGKTYLMDLFFRELNEYPARRQHFHRFMADIHKQLNGAREQTDPLRSIARHLHQKAKILCFDEFFVADVADAMILGRFFRHLFDQGTIVVATSNVAPDDLYKDGLQRSQFLPAIDAIKHHCHVLRVDGGQDYRLRVLQSANIYCWPHQLDTDEYLEQCFIKIAPDPGNKNTFIRIEGRQIQTVRRADGIAWFTFDAICDGPRGAIDYIEIARTFQSVIVSSVPVMNINLDNQARRFITMVDEFYDRRVKLIISAAAPIERLYRGSRLQFEFERTQSRLIEMQGDDYLAQPHLP